MPFLRRALLLLVCSLLTAAPRSVWVWEVEARRLMGDRAFEAQVVSLLQQQGIATLYLHANPPAAPEPGNVEQARLRALIASLHASGLRVEALLGSYSPGAGEGTAQGQDPQAGAMLQRILDFNSGSRPQERFDGVHLDFEPHALDSWNDSSRAALSQAYLSQSKAWVALARNGGPGFRIGAAIPFWYAGFDVDWQGLRQPLNAHVQDLYDYVAVMDYRDRAEGPDGIIAHARRPLAHGSRIGKPVVLGLETADVQPAKVSFHHRGPAALAREMAATEAALAQEPAFAGFALHHLRTWMALLDRRDHPSTALPPPRR